MADDPYKRERSQDRINEAKKRLRIDFDKAEDSSSPQRQKLSPQRETRSPQRERQSPERGKLSPQRGKHSPRRARRSPERNKEAKHRKDTDLPRSSNSLSSDIMKRLQPAGNLILI